MVAGEIKELAQQTSAATEDIKGRIDAIQKAAGAAVADIQHISGVIRDVRDIVAAIATAIEEQSIATRDIAGNIAQAASGVQDASAGVIQSSNVSQGIAGDIARVDAAARHISESAGRCRGRSTEMTAMAGNLSTAVAAFQTGEDVAAG